MLGLVAEIDERDVLFHGGCGWNVLFFRFYRCFLVFIHDFRQDK